MKKVATMILLVMVFTTILIYLPSKSFACSCAEPGTVTEEVNRNGAVFSGRVIKQSEDVGLFRSSADPVSVLFNVDNSWKGVNQTQVIVETESSSASCGYEFTANEKYLVYASDRNGELHASLCSRTIALTDAESDLEVLGMGTEPSEVVHLENSLKDSSVGTIILWVVIGIVVAGGVILVKRFRT
ncbi:hypothetical protein [Virgibacillus sp. DJP39]|uniref:hypothetical protein n=1 Tax=Virgibacillus sp. DJP39 TaxID=3409790 RepID=UPI003BB758D4